VATKPAYAVGYGRPPKATRFKKGESGNPKGRPKGSRPVGAILQEILEQRIAVTENGRTRRIPALEVMLRCLANDAMRNDVAALKTILTLVDRYHTGSTLTSHREPDQKLLQALVRAHAWLSDLQMIAALPSKSWPAKPTFIQK
jgi:hypothetical protein